MHVDIHSFFLPEALAATARSSAAFFSLQSPHQKGQHHHHRPHQQLGPAVIRKCSSVTKLSNSEVPIYDIEPHG